jgi:peptide-methionine (S)-S-oxide reductase
MYPILILAAFLIGCEELEMTESKSNKTEKAAAQPDVESATDTAYFAAGCFWGVEAAYRNVQGVKATAVGYMGGHTVDPTYKDVCTDTTGHAEAVKVEYDPAKVSYEQLLETFWSVHNPTTMNRQEPDVGSQYRSAIFTNDKKQYDAAIEARANLAHSERFQRPIVTRISSAKEFYRAEEYHQRYLEKHGKASCGIISPH